MQHLPRITIITVVYNAAPDLERTIQSVRSQNYPDIEYIVIDGGSTDGTLEVIQKNTDLISRWESGKDKGIYDAMNKGIALATGGWINFLNAGDWYMSPSVISEVVALAPAEADFIYGNHEARHETFIKQKKALPPHSLWKHMIFSHQTLFVRTSYQKERLFSLAFKVAADFNFIFNAYKDGAKFFNTDLYIASYDMGGHSAKAVIKAYQENRDIVLKRENSLRVWAFHSSLILKQRAVLALKSILSSAFFEGLMRAKNSIKPKNISQMKNETQSVIFFDGHCNLCNSSVNFIIDRDPGAFFKFASLQSDAAREMLSAFPTEARPDSIALLQNGQLYWRTSAVLRIARSMTGLWPLLYVFLIVPPFIRNAVYDWIAKNRYRWFGREETCRIPEPGLKSRFL